MKTNDLINENSDTIKLIIKELPNHKFDSHEFIKVFAKKFDPQYITLLALYEKNQHRIVHAQIALNLSKNMDYLEIEKNGKVISETVFGLDNPNKFWNKKV